MRKIRKYDYSQDETLPNGAIIHWTERKRFRNRFNWYYRIPVTCPDCGTKRFVTQGMITFNRRKGIYTGLCQHCIGHYTLPTPPSGPDSPNWKGKYTSMHGYVYINVPADHPFACMAPPSQQTRRHNGWVTVLEHRLVMAKHLNRPLHSWEIVHHIDSNTTNNNINNLALMTKSTHKQVEFLLTYIRKLEKQLKELDPQFESKI